MPYFIHCSNLSPDDMPTPGRICSLVTKVTAAGDRSMSDEKLWARSALVETLTPIERTCLASPVNTHRSDLQHCTRYSEPVCEQLIAVEKNSTNHNHDSQTIDQLQYRNNHPIAVKKELTNHSRETSELSGSTFSFPFPIVSTPPLFTAIQTYDNQTSYFCGHWF